MSSVFSDHAAADSQSISLEPSLLHRLLKKYSALDSYRSALPPNIRQSSLLSGQPDFDITHFYPLFSSVCTRYPVSLKKCCFKGIMTLNLVTGIPHSTHRKAWPLRQARKSCACHSHPASTCEKVFHSCAHRVNICRKAHLNRSGIWAQH